MGNVQHLTIEAYRSGVGLGFESFHDTPGVSNLRFAGVECLVDHIDLCRMNRELSRKSVTARRGTGCSEAGCVPEVRKDGVDGGNARSSGTEQTE